MCYASTRRPGLDRDGRGPHQSSGTRQPPPQQRRPDYYPDAESLNNAVHDDVHRLNNASGPHRQASGGDRYNVL